ncbi:MAG: hypothetical protein H6668_20655 [Ardenticatenaceae bacterium]|nr:hypothetical protein [Ardenticatenaceae bacterium]
MNPKQKRRYLTAVYLILVITAITLLILGFDHETNSWQSVFLNLSTELFAVAAVFFLVDFMFSVGDWELSERVDELVKQLQEKRPSADSFFQDPPSIDTFLQTANSIDLCGITLTSTLNKKFDTIRKKLLDGANLRILIIAPEFQTLQMAALRSEERDNVEYYQHRLGATLNDIESFHKNWLNSQKPAGNLAVRFMKYPPSFGIMSFDKEKDTGTMVIELYPHHTGYGLPPNFVITKQEDPKWHSYFAEQFEAMWQAATDWQPGINVTNILLTDSSQARVEDILMTRLPPLEPFLKNAREIKISGYALERTVRENMSILEGRLKAGASMKILLLSEDKLTIKPGIRKGRYYDQALSLKATLKNLSWLSHESKNLASIEVRFMDEEPNFNIISIDSNELDGHIFVEFYPMEWVSEGRPRIELTKARDAYWFQYFETQFEAIWAKSRPFTLDEYHLDETPDQF